MSDDGGIRSKLCCCVALMDATGRSDGEGSTSIATKYWEEIRGKLVDALELSVPHIVPGESHD